MTQEQAIEAARKRGDYHRLNDFLAGAKHSNFFGPDYVPPTNRALTPEEHAFQLDALMRSMR